MKIYLLERDGVTTVCTDLNDLFTSSTKFIDLENKCYEFEEPKVVDKPVVKKKSKYRYKIPRNKASV